MPRRGHHQEKIIRALKQADARVNGGESCREHGIRIEETYVRVKGKWRYLYRALDSTGATIDFLLSTNRDAEAARRFLAQSLGRNKPFPSSGSSTPANMPLIRSQSLELQAEGALEENRRYRPGPYLNNAWSRIIGRSRTGSTLDDVMGNAGVTSRTLLG